MTEVKFCGLTNLQDCLDAVEAGADYLGFNFYSKSPRSITPAACRQIILALRATLGPDSRKLFLVGVFVGVQPEEVLRTLEECLLDLAQLSGNETPESIQACGPHAYAAVRTSLAAGLNDQVRALPIRRSPPAVLVDADVTGQFGGTGRLADWEQARELATHTPFFLAGGLTPENVAEALRVVRPWGVDVASGIESFPGKKDAVKMHRFVQAVRQAYQE